MVRYPLLFNFSITYPPTASHLPSTLAFLPSDNPHFLTTRASFLVAHARLNRSQIMDHWIESNDYGRERRPLRIAVNSGNDNQRGEGIDDTSLQFSCDSLVQSGKSLVFVLPPIYFQYSPQILSYPSPFLSYVCRSTVQTENPQCDGSHSTIGNAVT